MSSAAHVVGALVLADDAMATPVFSYARACGVDIAILLDHQTRGRQGGFKARSSVQPSDPRPHRGFI
jgi:O-succinylhomoserine sulfhydrylase